MRENRILNAGVGALLLLAMVSTMFIAFFASSQDWRNYKGYHLYASFDESAGLRSRAPVRIAGVQVGEVVSVELTDMYQAKVLLRINDTTLNLSSDTSAHIYTEGLLGVRYIALFPGYEKDTLENNGEIVNTNSGFVLENLIGQVLMSEGISSEEGDDEPMDH